MQFFISTIADLNYSWDETLQKESISYVHNTSPIAKANGLGLELAEFCIAENCEHTEKVFYHFLENIKSVNDLILHAPYNELFVHAIDPAVSNVARDRYAFCYALCEKYGIKKMVVHANYVPSLYFPEWFKARNIEFWKSFLQDNLGGCQIVMENTMENDPSIITDIIKNVNDDRLKMCLDVGHANLHTIYSVYDWLDMSAPYLSHLHIHNNNGPVESAIGSSGDLHSALGNGIIDYENFLSKSDSMLPELTATIESMDFEKSVEWLKEKRFI